MTVDRLPRILRNTIDIYELNQRLLDGDAALDWSGVRVADADALAALLADVDPVRHADALGLHTVPEGLRPRIDTILGTAVAQPSRRPWLA
jgi:hypothetical protein